MQSTVYVGMIIAQSNLKQCCYFNLVTKFIILHNGDIHVSTEIVTLCKPTELIVFRHRLAQDSRVK